jgi:hypothetical protein
MNPVHLMPYGRKAPEEKPSEILLQVRWRAEPGEFEFETVTAPVEQVQVQPVEQELLSGELRAGMSGGKGHRLGEQRPVVEVRLDDVCPDDACPGGRPVVHLAALGNRC